MSTQNKNRIVESDSAEETIAFGKKLAGTLNKSQVVVLSGSLGAGKTTLIKGIALGLGVANEDIKSPSFTLVNEYSGNFPLYHFDLYRMKSSSELYEIGWDEYIMRDGIVLVEWGEKAARFLPEPRIEIYIKFVSDNKRRLDIRYIPD
jgi:tRNA threonylcarbamoyladenosine biosynthesis protein TsaE